MRLGFAIIALLLVANFSCSPTIARPALLFDAGDGKVIYAEDADDLWHPASLTKMMTAYLAFEAIKNGKLSLKGKVTCSRTANKQPPSKIGLPVGGEMTVELALKALIIKSANDVAVMVAEAVAGSEAAFVEKMNATALRLGMTRTRFSNPHGLPASDQVTTARDLARLARAVVSEYPQYADYWATPSMRLGKARLHSHNALLRSFKGADGMKTGFICDSGFNVVASATRDGRRLMAIVLGEPDAKSRNIRAASLLEHGFRQFGWEQLFNHTTVDTLPLSSDTKGVTSVRDEVTAWSCGGEKARISKKNFKKKNKKKTAKK